MNKTINFGIDLGTTNSAIAKFQEGEVVVFKNPASLKETISSVVACKGQRIIIGDKARELLHKSGKDVFGFFKRKMGTSEVYMTEDMEQQFTAIELSSIILKELKNAIHTGENPEAVVITIPAAFDTIQSNATKKAGQLAGFSEVVLLQEPIAASLAFANKSNLEIESGKWLVYDLGGGTFDVALTAIQDGEMKIQDHEGDNYLGGTDIDRAIIDQFVIPAIDQLDFVNNAESELKKSTGKLNRLYYKLLFLIEEAKKTLSHSEVAEIEFEVKDDQGKEHEIFLELHRNVFNEIISPIINRTLEMIQTIMDRNDLSKDDLLSILLIGGSTYIPYVRESLSVKFGIEINTSMDPTTAVVVGAAYYAGLKTKTNKGAMEVPEAVVTTNVDTDKIRLAFEKVVQDDTAVLLIQNRTNSPNLKFRIIRNDGGYDSGLTALSDTHTLDLSMVSNSYNEFTFTVTDDIGNKIYVESLGITHGKFSIDGQPLPSNICLEVDSIEDETTFLEPIFKKNDILPLKKTIIKQVSKTINKDSDDSIVIKVLEGDIDSLPIANKSIGTIEINGRQLARDLIKGSDIELTFQMSESRDLHIAAYLSLTDQDFEDTFSPTKISLSPQSLVKELRFYTDNLRVKLKSHEEKAEFREAAAVQALIEEVISLIDEAGNIEEGMMSDEIYILDGKKRELGKKIQKLYSSSLLTKTIEKYYKFKKGAEVAVLDDLATPQDKIALDNIISNENVILREGNVTSIKMKISSLEEVSNSIYRRKPMKLEDYVLYFPFYKNAKYKNPAKANDLIASGEKAISSHNLSELPYILNSLHEMLDKGDSGLFKSKDTGIK